MIIKHNFLIKQLLNKSMEFIYFFHDALGDQRMFSVFIIT